MRNGDFKTWMEQQWQRFGHQKEFPFMRSPDDPFRRQASFYLPGEAEELAASAYPPESMYHVTTNLPAVRASGRLKSRRELGSSGIGLGGGPDNMAPDAVSLTYNYGRALEIYEGLRFVSGIVAGRIPASQIYDYVQGQNQDQWTDYYDNDSAVERVLMQYVSKKTVKGDDTKKIKQILDRKIVSPKDRYEFLQEMESAVTADNPSEDWSDTYQFDPVIGFTAPFARISHLKPQDIAIIQVAVRKSAKPSHYSQEAELRVDPRDVVIVRYLQP